MSEKPNFNWDAVKPGGEENDQEYIASIIEELNELNRKTGRPEVRLMSNEEARTSYRERDAAKERELELAKEREAELAKEKDQDLTRQQELALEEERAMEQTRGLDVRRIMAEETAERERAAAKEQAKVREIIPETKIVKKPSEFDPEMQEITLERAKRKEIDVIGQGTEPVNKELAKRVEEIMALKKELEEVEQEISSLKEAKVEEEPKNPDALVAVGVDWTKSEDRLARKLARKDLKEELKDANIIKRIWKGNLFKKYYEDKYMDEYLDGDRLDKNGRDLYEIIDDQKREFMDDIVFDVTEDVRELNRAEYGRRLKPMDEETNAKIKSTVEDYARFMYEISQIRPDMANDPEFVQEVDDKFNGYMVRVLEDAENDGRIEGFIETNNYLNVAKEAADRYKEAAKNAVNKVEQDAAMAKVMLGFRAYNYEAMKRFSERRRGNIDRIVDRLGGRSVVSARAFSNAVDRTNIDNEEARIVDNIKNSEELIGGEEGIKIMLDKSPISVESQKRWNAWWDSLTDEGRDYVKKLIKQVNAYPDRYNLKWGNGFRTWLTIKNARDILAA